MVTKSSLSKGVWDTYNSRILKLRQQGLTLQLIGDKVGVTRERIRQILKEHYGTTKISGFITRNKLAGLLKCSNCILTTLERKGLLNPLHYGSHYLYTRDEAKKAAILVAQAREPDVERTCEVCGKQFYVRPYDIKHTSPRRFCSRQCHGAWFGKYFGYKRKYDWDRIWQLYQEGKVLSEIAQLVGASCGTVNGILCTKRRQLGVAPRPRVKRAGPITQHRPSPEENGGRLKER